MWNENLADHVAMFLEALGNPNAISLLLSLRLGDPVFWGHTEDPTHEELEDIQRVHAGIPANSFISQSLLDREGAGLGIHLPELPHTLGEQLFLTAGHG